MLPFSKDRLNHDDTVIIQLVSGSGEAQDLKLVNYVFAAATSEIQSGREWANNLLVGDRIEFHGYCHSNQIAWVHFPFSLMIHLAVMLHLFLVSLLKVFTLAPVRRRAVAKLLKPVKISPC